MGAASAEIMGEGLPVAPVAAMTLVQAFGTMTVFAIPVMAPEMAPDLGVPPDRVGLWTSMLYVIATTVAIFCPDAVVRYGGVRISQAAMVSCAGALGIASSGTLPMVVASAVLLGLGYALVIPAASHILIRRTPPRLRNRVFSIRQAGVPIGGMAAGALLPPLAVAQGWRAAFLLLAVAPFVMALMLQLLRRDLDADREATAPLIRRNPLGQLTLLWSRPALRRLAGAGFFFAGLELCFGSFLSSYLTTRAGFDLVLAGIAIAVFQAGGLTGRLLFGWLADLLRAPQRMLGGLGISMGAVAVVAGFFATGWPTSLILIVCFFAGLTSGGWTGVGIAEAARLAGPGLAAAGASSLTVAMFGGVIVAPSLFSLIVSITDSYTPAYAAAAFGALGGGAVLLAARRSRTEAERTT